MEDKNSGDTVRDPRTRPGGLWVRRVEVQVCRDHIERSHDLRRHPLGLTHGRRTLLRHDDESTLFVHDALLF
jgi:hypothetical protein